MLNRFQNDNLEKAYSEEFLLHEILESAGELTDYEFGKFQHSILQLFFSGIEFERIAVCRQCADAEVWNAPASHGKVVSWDKARGFSNTEGLTPAARRSRIVPDNSIFQYDVIDDRGWYSKSVSSEDRKLQNGPKPAFVAKFCIPNRQDEQFVFEYFAKNSTTIANSCVTQELQYLSIPFYFAWLMRQGCIDCQTLTEWYRLLVGVTPTRMRLLREIVNAGRYQTAVVASNMKLSDRVVRNYISEAINSIAHLLPEPDLPNANNSQCIDLVRYYWFLRFVGTA